MNGRKIKHKLKDDATDIAKWYHGKIVGISEDITMEHVGYTDTFKWDKADIKEDIRNSDLNTTYLLQPLGILHCPNNRLIIHFCVDHPDKVYCVT